MTSSLYYVLTSMNARQRERKSTDSFSLSILVVLYLNKESETARNPFINSCAIICFKRIGAHGRNSFIAADTPTTQRDIGRVHTLIKTLHNLMLYNLEKRHY